MTNHYTDVCEETIKSLRQQLSDEFDKREALDNELAVAHVGLDAAIESNNDQIAQIERLEKQIVMLRDAIEYGFDNPDFDGETFDRQLQEALDATADVSKKES